MFPQSTLRVNEWWWHKGNVYVCGCMFNSFHCWCRTLIFIKHQWNERARIKEMVLTKIITKYIYCHVIPKTTLYIFCRTLKDNCWRTVQVFLLHKYSPWKTVHNYHKNYLYNCVNIFWSHRIFKIVLLVFVHIRLESDNNGNHSYINMWFEITFLKIRFTEKLFGEPEKKLRRTFVFKSVRNDVRFFEKYNSHNI